MEVDNKGLRYNENKPRWDLMPFDALDALADHFRKGAEKYEERNWERGMDYSKMLASLCRHTSSFAQGEDYDAEGNLHTAAMAWNALGLLTYQLRNIGVDDRAKVQGRQAEAASASEEPYSEGPTDFASLAAETYRTR